MQGSGFLSILSDPGECRVQASLKAGEKVRVNKVIKAELD